MAAPRKIDWELIEPDWRAGVKGPTKIAIEYEKATGVRVTDAAIIQHFRKLGISRDLTEKIRAEATAIVNKAMVSPKVSLSGKLTLPADVDIINAVAAKSAEKQIGHMNLLERDHGVSGKLWGQLSAVASDPELFENLGEMLRDPEAKQTKLEELYRQVISLPGQVDTFKKLVDADKTLIEMDRKTFKMDETAKTPGQNLDSFLDGLKATASN